jgi:hypothetical protein
LLILNVVPCVLAHGLACSLEDFAPNLLPLGHCHVDCRITRGPMVLLAVSVLQSEKIQE